MNVEAIVWTVVFFGGVIMILTFLLFKAMQADKEDARRNADEEQAGHESE
jgi:hypothetical protein